MTHETLTDADAHHLRATLDAAGRLARRGELPFTARLVDTAGRVRVEAENAVQRSGDPTAHAEVMLVRAAAREGAATLAGATVYTAVEPCGMCAAALVLAGVARVVYGISDQRVGPHLHLPAGVVVPGVRGRQVFDATPAGPFVVGPALEDEALLRAFGMHDAETRDA
jgi:tRNA(adenine34) deaminase